MKLFKKSAVYGNVKVKKVDVLEGDGVARFCPLRLFQKSPKPNNLLIL